MIFLNLLKAYQYLIPVDQSGCDDFAFKNEMIY